MTRRMMLAGVLLAVLLTGGGAVAGAWLYRSGLAAKIDTDAEVAVTDVDKAVDNVDRQAQPLYYSFDPPFTTNEQGSDAMIQVGVSISTHFATTIENVKNDSPALRSSVLLALSDVSAVGTISDLEKKQLALKIQANINRQLQADGYSPSVDGVYFTDFIVQGDDGNG